MAEQLNLKEELLAKGEEFKGSDAIFGMTALTNPGYISASRSIMFTNHLKQAVCLINPDYPRVSTNYENLVGKYSTGYFKTDEELEVYAIVPKFNQPGLEKHIYYLFTYDPKNDKYDVKEKRLVEDLTEKFGYEYDNTVMDSLNEGDTIPKDTVLYKTHSYDEDMNYMYGKQATFMYVADTRTTEDAICVSESFAKELLSIEVETGRASLNDNDIFINYYGDKNNYKCFPDIGEKIKNKMVGVMRRIHNKEVLYSLKKENLRKVFNSDSPVYINLNGGTLIDINIYSNKTIDEIPNNVFNAQIIKYLKMQEEFYTRIFEVCDEIRKSGSKVSRDINFLWSKAKNILDPDVKFKDTNGSVFSNMVIEFTVKREVGISPGQKITGRYGNKGVVSAIIPDDEMPFLENGKRVDVLFNLLGVVNRLNSFQLFEQSITFICDRVIERMQTMDSIKSKWNLLYDIVSRFNPEEGKALKKYYGGLSTKEKKEFFEDIDKTGIYVHIPPMWENEDSPLFQIILNIYRDYEWIQPYKVYINKWGRTIQLMNELPVGSMYIMKLKQTSKKQFSGRSTGIINQRGLPSKSTRAKYNEELHSDTPITHGDQEVGNMMVGLEPESVAKMHLYYRSSIVGRRDLGVALATSINTLEDFPESPLHTNVNVQILRAYLKCMGVGYEFDDEYENIDIPIDHIETFHKDGQIFIGNEIEFEHFKNKEKAIEMLENEYVYVGDEEGYEREVEELANAIENGEIDDNI